MKMVGTARFELATSRTPSVRATRLRYVPTERAKTPVLEGFAMSELKPACGRQAPTPNSTLTGYHRRSRSVKKARSVSRRSSSIFRLRS